MMVQIFWLLLLVTACATMSVAERNSKMFTLPPRVIDSIKRLDENEVVFIVSEVRERNVGPAWLLQQFPIRQILESTLSVHLWHVEQWIVSTSDGELDACPSWADSLEADVIIGRQTATSTATLALPLDWPHIARAPDAHAGLQLKTMAGATMVTVHQTETGVYLDKARINYRANRHAISGLAAFLIVHRDTGTAMV